MAALGGVFEDPAAGRGGPVPGWIERIRQHLLLDIVDLTVLAQKTATALHEQAAVGFTGVAVREASGLYAMHGVAGGRDDRTLRSIRLSTGQGLGGQVIARHQPVVVTDYVQDPAITAHFRHLAVSEAFASMSAVPVLADDEVVGVLYMATRQGCGMVGDRVVTLMEEAAGGLADLLATAVRHDEAIRQQAAAERMRIAEELHDRLGQLLFGIGVSAKKLRPDTSLDFDATTVGLEIEGQAKQAAGYLRDALRLLGPQSPSETLPVAMRMAVEDFSHRSGTPAQLVVLGDPRGVLPEDEAALLGMVREALHNVEKHARASLVTVTVRFDHEVVRVAIQDDGRGLPPGFVLQPVPSREHGWGLPSILRQVQQRGGTFDVHTGEEGGTTVRGAIRCSAADAR